MNISLKHTNRNYVNAVHSLQPQEHICEVAEKTKNKHFEGPNFMGSSKTKTNTVRRTTVAITLL
jgi:hypothetical protein